MPWESNDDRGLINVHIPAETSSRWFYRQQTAFGIRSTFRDIKFTIVNNRPTWNREVSWDLRTACFLPHRSADASIKRSLQPFHASRVTTSAACLLVSTVTAVSSSPASNTNVEQVPPGHLPPDLTLIPKGLFTAHELNWPAISRPIYTRVHWSRALRVTTWPSAAKLGRLVLSRFTRCEQTPILKL